MPSTCCVPLCSNRGGHAFPLSKPDLVKKWLVAMRKEHYVPSRHSIVCRSHFSESDYNDLTTSNTVPLFKILRPGAVPSIFAWTAQKPAAPYEWEQRYKERMNQSPGEIISRYSGRVHEEVVATSVACTNNDGNSTKPEVKYLRKHAVPSVFSMTKGPKPPKKPKKPKVVHRIKEVYVVKIKTANIKQECDGSAATTSNQGVREVTIQKQDLTNDAVQTLFTPPKLPNQQHHQQQQQKQQHLHEQQHRPGTNIDANLRYLVNNVLLPGTLGQGAKNLDSRITVMAGHSKPDTSTLSVAQCSNSDIADQSNDCLQMIEPKVEIKQEKEDYVETQVWNVVT